jgi:cell division protein FtsL
MLLEAAQRSQDEALAVQSRLLIERSALAAYQNVERTAQVKLDMQFPTTVERVSQ